jgi:hypothetical protein
MSLLRWLQAKKTEPVANGGRRPRRSFGQTTLPLISPRRGRRILRREQLFSVVRESMIRAGVLSTSYEFKVLTLDANGDGFLVLIELALPAEVMPDAYLLEIERWIQIGSRSRHDMLVQAVYWRRKADHDQRGIALKAAVAAQTRQESRVESATAIPRPDLGVPSGPAQTVAPDEVEAFRQAMLDPALPAHRMDPMQEPAIVVPESHSDFSALSETQYGKL